MQLKTEQEDTLELPMPLQRGTVKLQFDTKPSGIITPDNGENNVYFHQARGRVPFEGALGEITFHPTEHARAIQHANGLHNTIPQKGDRVIYWRKSSTPSDVAASWAYADEWDRGVKIITSRPSPKQPLTRAFRIAEDHYSKIIVWEGFIDRLAEAVRLKKPFLSIPGLHFEWRLAHSWLAISDIREYPFEEVDGVYDEEMRLRSMRAYLALLIERGVGTMRRSQGPEAFATALRYAAIGRTRLVNGNHSLWGLEPRLPFVKPPVLRTIYGVSLITNLDPIFLALTLANPIDDRSCAKQLVQQLRGNEDVGLYKQGSTIEEFESVRASIEKYAAGVHL